jgi:hypothetical protein
MYALGQVPLILQGAASRERLSPEQMARVQAMMAPGAGTVAAPLTPARVGLSPLVVAALVAVGVWLIGASKSKGTQNW